MELDTAICRRAMRSRDARFDGRFFIGVLTTGVYCRPVCPVRQPKLENVRFFPSAAAAAEAGLRPCLRCRPEASPGTPAWFGTSATVTRALRLIAAGALDEGSVADLASQLGVGTRHLGRLFTRHLGASPVTVAQTRRLHLSKKLIDETDLPMSQVGLAAGFSSVRRFNAAFARTYGRTPSALRRSARRKTDATSSNRLALRLPYRPPFDWSALIGFLAPRATPGVELVSPERYRRTITLEGRRGSIEVYPVAERHELEIEIELPEPTLLTVCVDRARRIFDLDAAPSEIAAHLSRDPDLANAVEARPGLRLPGAWDGFELAVRAILGQQVSVKGATTLAGRVAERFGTRIEQPARPGLDRLFPEPETLATADLTGVGLPGARARSINALARAVLEGRLRFDRTTDLDSFVGEMTRIPGIGEWTAHYVAMRALNEPDAFPANDLGLRKALSRDGKPIAERELGRLAERWRPWRAYAAIYLWSGLDRKADARLSSYGSSSSTANGSSSVTASIMRPASTSVLNS